MLLQIVRLPTAEEMHSLIDKITNEGMTREDARDYKRDQQQTKRRNFTYRFKPEDRDYRFTLTFARPEIERSELIETLQEILTRLVEEEKNERGARDH
jgi:Ser/Thr protein kinase RdoA (MazF antagonist)